ncbi:hypothetical protein [Photorhabdus noenieputensis]|uniref:hypothetical protein n=1 Tax=Photorhabdus noenieputensis TaxID=1208607 RepID=UPI001BD339D6|nr:hypothetical protein [Photorhabdus noenieputensis]MCK3670948.1 hypothetical protein [Photorhabdus noenieputensis]
MPSTKLREWAEYRAELNSSRHTLHKRHEELKARASQHRKEEWAAQKACCRTQGPYG